MRSRSSREPPDVSALMCDVHSVPLATNQATAEAVVELMENAE